MTKLVHYIVIVVVFVVSAIGAETMAVGEIGSRELKGIVMDAASGLPVAGAVVVDDRGGWAVADTLGAFVLDISYDGAIGLTISSLGYHTLKTSLRDDGTYSLMVDAYALDEVVVTATEGKGATSVSHIGADAIGLIQPSSFADVLELLPGGMSKDPVLSSPQLINLRSANELSNSDYATSALGTGFMIDGRRVGGDANLQQSPMYSSLGSSFVNMGTDMREITTEDIESVDVIRGIASVEYGDITSGLVKIRRRKGGNDVSARFKADMESKLFYLGKGFEWGGQGGRHHAER